MTRIFTSGLKKYMADFIEQKHAMGFPYTDGERITANFDAFCAAHYPDCSTITKEMGLHWAAMRENEGRKNIATRVGVVRELARFMQREGMEAYIIPSDYGKNPAQRYTPHIFTDGELAAVFHAADNLPVSSRDCTCHLVAPVLFRLLYCCGLRPSEGRLAKRKNIDLDHGIILIPESKGHKDRIVAMPDDMVLLCRKYDALMRSMYPDSEYFFPSSRKRPSFCHHWVSNTLWRCWNNAGLGDYSGNAPRPYDFRHTFATKTLYRWLKEGRSLDSCLPYLSAYMGHARFEHTAYYIHLVPEFFPQMSQMDFNRFSELIPEVPHEIY
nr:tyrosine-type recombinase/integrase [uncultured Schaedlerella sp.]